MGYGQTLAVFLSLDLHIRTSAFYEYPLKTSIASQTELVND